MVHREEAIDGDGASGTVYVLSRRSDSQLVTANRNLLRKIGVIVCPCRYNV
jgi:hypothetical protein